MNANDLSNGIFLGCRVGKQFQMQGGYNFALLKMASRMVMSQFLKKYYHHILFEMYLFLEVTAFICNAENLFKKL